MVNCSHNWVWRGDNSQSQKKKDNINQVPAIGGAMYWVSDAPHQQELISTNLCTSDLSYV